MFSEEDSSGDEIDMYTMLFLSSCNALGNVLKFRTKKIRITAKNEETAFFLSSTNFFNQLNMAEMVRLHGSINETWHGINKCYVES